ncbi:hypothetical protein PR202_ga08693 [Eleusine coracana subsp. coracana]|uniref:PHD finger protein ALFIN-LIKE n=1 Tax=Eleusine coracana subsp. coracana TaxID=191504 RepID=A0AAV5C0W1_ELECO|nr:hypothetical protein PR202_ga08693 [Eleusine coracana subsp. coracana]
MDGGGSGAATYTVRTPEEVFRDYRARRAGMIKALTTDVDKFFKLCDPALHPGQLKRSVLKVLSAVILKMIAQMRCRILLWPLIPLF